MVRNRKFTILILIVSVLALASITEFGRQAVQAIQAQTRPTQPQRWEYCTVNMITPGSGVGKPISLTVERSKTLRATLPGYQL